MKKILIMSPCQKRGETIGLIGQFLNGIKILDRKKYEIDLFDTNYLFGEKHDPNNYPVERYYSIPYTLLNRLIRKIPKFRVAYSKRITIDTLKRILHSEPYNLLIIYQVPIYCEQIIDIAHQEGVKVMIVPWGGDILRVSNEKQKKLQSAFDKTDYVQAIKNSNCAIEVKDIYCVDEAKLKLSMPYLSGVRTLMSIDKTKTREEMSQILGIPTSSCNIVCGYSGEETQRHTTIIDAFIKNKNILPNDYQLIFPVTYCAKPSYIEKLKSICSENGLKAFFFTEFLTNEHMAYLHILSDLVIQIQPWDNGSAFMIESLFCRNQIVTGKWLKYRQFEQFGLPYHLIDKPEDLSIMINKIFMGEVDKISIPQELIDIYTIPNDYKAGMYWNQLIPSIV